MEVAAGLVAAEQIISTTIEAALVGGYAIAKPTQPLKAKYTRIATSAHSDAADSLERSSHTVTVLHGKAYIFGGITSDGDSASNDIHIISLPGFSGSTEDYKCVPALGPDTPSPRANHTACAFGDDIYVFGGTTGGSWADHDSCIWVFSTTNFQWRKLDGPSISGENESAQVSHDLITSNGVLLLRLTTTIKSSVTQTQVYFIRIGDPASSWSSMSLPSSDVPLRIITAGAAIYALPTDTVKFSEVYLCPDISVSDPTFISIKLPSTTDTPLPQTRSGNQIVPISTGHGRHYLTLLPGVSSKPKETFSDTPSYLTDLWTLQLPSDSSSLTKIKDATREQINLSSGEFTWSEIVIEARMEELGTEGKALPGPLAHYAADTVDGKTVLMWGGVDATGETVGDGWLIWLE
ncbi:hypothetical protein FKW77_001080 [Venturia effusa]|uniref:Galactose oxidase n=1 Tax=Venturia effusa TaxID=50376 RepID=A0A517LJL1_9PEZI|nr:hypothetical protein FKW77_001080 [Venturia effusa]